MSQRERGLFLWDILEAGSEILRFTEGKDFAAYQQDSMLRAAVERKFEIIGEALSQAIRRIQVSAKRLVHRDKLSLFATA